MDDKRYNEIDNMTKEELETITDAEYEEYQTLRYFKLSNQHMALKELREHVYAAQQGNLEMWATGFPKLDEKLDGGFLGGNLIILGAISSLGKTTFALQIADQIAAQGKDVLIFSLEMSKNELNAKSISRNTFYLTDGGVVYDKNQKAYVHKTKGNADNRLTMSDILRGRVGEISAVTNQGIDGKGKLFFEALEQTEKLNKNLFIIRDNNMNVDRIESYIESHKKFRFQKPFVIIDYLQILKAQDESEYHDKRLLTDEDVNGLKDLAVRAGIPILLISSFNRNSYLDTVNMSSFKESGTIEYSSDTLIGLQYSGMQYQKHWFTDSTTKKKKVVYENKTEHETRVRLLLDKMDSAGANGDFLPIDVVLLKNRGVSKGKILFEFCPKYNVFCESQYPIEYYEWNHSADVDDSTSPSVVSSNGSSLGTI